MQSDSVHARGLAVALAYAGFARPLLTLGAKTKALPGWVARVSASATATLGDVPLFHAAWLFAAGIVMARSVWLRPAVVLIAVLLLGSLCAVAATRACHLVWLAMALLWVSLGAWCAEMEPQPAPVADLLRLSDGLLRTVEGTVIDASPVRKDPPQEDAPTADIYSQRVDLRLSSIEVVNDAEDKQAPMRGAIRLTVHWPDAASIAQVKPLGCGEVVRAVARLLPPETYRDAGVWSRAEFLLEQGITSTASVKIDAVQRSTLAAGSSWRCRVSTVQRMASARLLDLPAATHRLPRWSQLTNEDAIMLAAMVTGDRTFLAHPLRAGFERTGSFHMLVVSGLHLAIVAGCILWCARRLRVPRVPATMITIAASFAYALFTGFATPVQRSLWMVTIYLLGRLIYRERNALNTIGFAALCLLVASPRSLFESSLQMTLLAVIAIAGIAAPLLEASIHPYVAGTRQLRLIAMDVKLAPAVAQFRVTLRMLADRLQLLANRRMAWRAFPWAVRFALRVTEALVVTLVVELAMTLPMAIYFHRITLLALPVNLSILPLLTVLMPLALITLIALMLWPPLALFPAMAVAILLHAAVGLVHLFGSMDWADIRVATPLAYQSALFCGFIAWAVTLSRAKSRWGRRAAWMSLMAAAMVAMLPRAAQHPHDALLMEAIDVGQGDSLLLITPEGKTLLVDGGGLGGVARATPQTFDIGEEVVSAALWARGIRHLDVVALSHAHSDHMGGLPSIMRNFHPAELWVGNNPHFPAYLALLDEAMRLHMRVRTLMSGDKLTLGGTGVFVLAPLPGYTPGVQPSNNDSLVLRVAYASSSILLEGDAESPIEDAMLEEPDLASTLLKVAHHGSDSSTRPEFLARVAPQWAVISCGLHNRYGHPREEVLKALQDAHVRTFSTDIQGAVCFRLDGRIVEQDADCGGR